LKPVYLLVAVLFQLFTVTLYTTVYAVTVVPAPPKINAKSYLVSDFNSGKILVEENIDEKLEPASLTKMMTVYIVAGELAAGNIHLEDMVDVSEKAWRMEGSRMFIEVGKQVSVSDLLKGVIIQSGNDASVALAEYVAGGEDVFAEVMNQQARQLGMNHTSFQNSTGLPHADHYTTARDLAILTKALITNFPDIYSWHAVKEFSFNEITQHNRNRMLWRDDTVDGVKTGHTESAGYCLVVSAKRDDMRLISVIMGSDSEEARARSTQSILSYGFRFFETHKLYPSNGLITTGKVWKGDAEQLGLGVTEDLYITIPRGKYNDLETEFNLNRTIIAPVARGEVEGTVKVILEGTVLEEKPLIALESVNEGSIFQRLKDEIQLLFE
jgi:D-alanyl-D-alanine carboxypeptidase (penicillin-binding protein 5/6)